MYSLLKPRPTIFLSRRSLASATTGNLPVQPRFLPACTINVPSPTVHEPNCHQVWHNQTSSKVDIGIKPAIVPKDSINLKSFGRSKEKLEVDGTMLNWDVVGTGEHVVLLLPGALGSIQTDFGPIIHKFDTTKYTLVSWDPPGYGLSRPPNRDFSGLYLRRDAHRVVKLMNKLGFDKYSVLGWSNGGNTGNFIAAEYPSKVHKLVTWGTHAYLDERVVNFTKIIQDPNVWHPKMLAPLETMYGREYLLKLLNNWHKAVTEIYENKLDDIHTKCLSNITCPVLAIHGAEDPIVGVEQAEYLFDHIKNSKMWILPKAQHNMHLRYADNFLKPVTAFLDS